jgi:hypothetical protein
MKENVLLQQFMVCCKIKTYTPPSHVHFLFFSRTLPAKNFPLEGSKRDPGFDELRHRHIFTFYGKVQKAKRNGAVDS